jgi:hypothetical protein
MGQRHQHSDAGTDDSAWLNTLINTFERTEEFGDVPCDARTVSVMMSRLQRPAVTPARSHRRRRQATLEVQH